MDWCFFGVNVDSISFPTLNPLQVFDVRSHAGRVAQDVDAFLSNKQTVKEISFSGVLDTQIAPYLLDGIMGSASSEPFNPGSGTVAGAYAIPHNYSPTAITYGASDTGNHLTYTVSVISPASGKSIALPGMVFTSLTISGDMGEESGRLKFDATMQSGMSAAFDDTEAIDTAYGSTYFSLGDTTTARTVAGTVDNLIQSFSLTIENPANFHGVSGSNFEIISRAIPEIAVNCDITMKYDANSLELDSEFAGAQITRGLLTQVSDHATITSATANKFSFLMNNSVITNFAFNEGAAMLVDVSLKALADPSEATAGEKAVLVVKI